MAQGDQFQPVNPQTLLIFNAGDLVGIKNPNANGADLRPASSATLAAKTQTEWGFSFGIDTVGNQDYTIIVKAPHAGTITETTSQCTSGTATATFKINGVALGGTANAVSSSIQSQPQASANTFAAGDKIIVTMSANSSCLGAAFSVKYTRTLQ